MVIQLQFLNYLLNSKDTSILMTSNIDDSFFSDYKAEYNFIRDHITNFNSIPDKVTFASKFKDFDFIEVSESPSFLVDELYKDKNVRALAKVFNGIRNCINSGDIDGAMDLFNSSHDQLLESSHLEAVDILKDKQRYDAYVDRTQDFSKFYIKTGFDELDQLIGGWDRLEELATIVARPGIGKSWVLLKCAIAAVEQGLNVGMYSGEMSELKVGYRFDTLVGHISNSSIIRGNVEIQNTYKQFIDTLSSKYKGSLKVITPKMLKRSATVADLEAFIEREKLDILCIDQHSLMEDQRRAKDPVTRAANISKDLKNLQVLKRIPIIAVSQQNRSAVDGDGLLDVSHIAQADRIGQDSTVVVFLEQKDKVMTLHLAKARDSGAGAKLKYAIDLDKGIFQFIPNEEDGLNGADCDQLRQEFEPTYCESGEEPF